MQNYQNQKRFYFKLCFLGAGGVGRTTLLKRYLTKQFCPDTKMTIGINAEIIYMVVTLANGEELLVPVIIWDFAGQERYRFPQRGYMHGFDGGIYFFDLTRMKTLDGVDHWISLWAQNKTPDAPFYFVGCKSDREEDISVPSEYICEIIKVYEIKKSFNISNKSGKNTSELLQSIVIDMWNYKYGDFSKLDENIQPYLGSTLQLNSTLQSGVNIINKTDQPIPSNDTVFLPEINPFNESTYTSDSFTNSQDKLQTLYFEETGKQSLWRGKSTEFYKKWLEEKKRERN